MHTPYRVYETVDGQRLKKNGGGIPVTYLLILTGNQSAVMDEDHPGLFHLSHEDSNPGVLWQMKG